MGYTYNRRLMIFRYFTRIFLVFSLLVFFFRAPFVSEIGEWKIFRTVSAQSENGVGGGMPPEDTQLTDGIDFDLEGMLQLEEHFRPRILTFGTYTMVSGDIIGHIAVSTGLNEDTLISVNNIQNTRLMQIGQAIRIPNQDGIYYTILPGDSLDSIAERHDTTAYHITVVNQLFSENIQAGDRLFIPGGRMDWISRQEINGDLFIWPSIGRLSSPYGWRLDPFGSGLRQFHTGIDIAGSTGNPVRAAMAGRVAHVGYDNMYGNFVLINHHSGYRTLYAHMSTVRVRPGANVATGERIGDVGSTGQSTGPHLHFTVFRNGVTVNPRTLMR